MRSFREECNGSSSRNSFTFRACRGERNLTLRACKEGASGGVENLNKTRCRQFKQATRKMCVSWRRNARGKQHRCVTQYEEERRTQRTWNIMKRLPTADLLAGSRIFGRAFYFFLSKKPTTHKGPAIAWPIGRAMVMPLPLCVCAVGTIRGEDFTLCSQLPPFRGGCPEKLCSTDTYAHAAQ